MKYAVTWKDKAEQELAAIWTASGDQDAVTRAADVLDRVLGHAPLRVGESRTSSVHRIAYFPPLGVEYEVIVDDLRVIVQAVFAAS